MRVVYLLLLLYGITTISIEAKTIFKTTKEKETYSVALSGQVESIEVENSHSSDVKLTVNLKMELLNNGTKPAIFLEAKPPHLRGGVLAKNPNPSDFSSVNRLILAYYGESVDTSSEWIVLREALNQPSPPLDRVRILSPNESWKFEDSFIVYMPTTSSKNDFSDKRESWENVKKLSTVWLQATCQVWSLNLEPPSNDRTEKTFGRKLQRRWKDVGLLLLDNIHSEPIMLDLKTATYKPFSQ